MHTYFMTIILLANYQPVGITTIPGWHSFPDCLAQSGSIRKQLLDDGYENETFCSAGPDDLKPGGQTR